MACSPKPLRISSPDSLKFHRVGGSTERVTVTEHAGAVQQPPTKVFRNTPAAGTGAVEGWRRCAPEGAHADQGGDRPWLGPFLKWTLREGSRGCAGAGDRAGAMS